MPTSYLHYLNFNGEIINEKDTILEANNRGFLYGDAIFETMHCNGSEVQFFNDHYTRLIHGLNTLKMDIPGYFTQHFLHNQIEHLLKKNKLFQGVRARLTIYRNPGGLYTPLTSDFSYIIQTLALAEDNYVLNEKGLVIGMYNDISKPINLLSGIKSTNALLFVMAGLYKKMNQVNDCILLNEHGHVCESISSNIFFVKGKTLFTPSLNSGCLPGIMRKNIIQLAKENNIHLIEKDDINLNEIEKADEIFITNAISGIRWIVGFEQNRYYCNMAKTLMKLLNEKAFNS